MSSERRASAWLLAGLALLSLVWGTQFVVIRVGQETVPPLLTACLRFSVFAVAAQAMVSKKRLRAPAGWATACWRAAFGGSQAVAMSLLYVSERHIASALAAVLFGTAPFFVALLAHVLVRDEPLTARVLVSSALGFAGIAAIGLGTGSSPLVLAGVAAAIGAASASALNKVVAKRLVAVVPPWILLRDMACIVALATGAASWAFERHEPVTWSAAAVTSALYLGLVASAAASALYLALLRRLPVTTLAYLQFVVALIGVLAGVWIAGETLGLRHAAGAALILLGLLVIASRGRAGTTALGRAP